MQENNINTKPEKARRQKYSPQFKDQALERAEKEGIPQTAKDLGLPESMLYSWRARKNQSGQSLESLKIQQAEMARLRRENARLAEENSFLKKVATYFTKESK